MDLVTQVLAILCYLWCVAMYLVGRIDLSSDGADPNDAAFLGMEFHLSRFFPAL